ncbi:MAG: hypothetical protein P1U77_12350 [Rubripirellula sp.]|nr:hypothetical protein [Planctomycetaceae bacterium]MDF1842220.1 hypothetical protein [Rubripirellula sp.]
MTRKNRTVKRWFVGIAFLAVMVVIFFVIRAQGYVEGVEFSPTHFQQRQFSFYEIPLIHSQITPIRRTSATPRTATYVRQSGLIPTAFGPPTDWHLVSISWGLSASKPADAQLLVDQLELSTGSSDYWRDWSKDHPQHAKVFWPVIQKLAIRELYVLMPPLFEIAQNDQSAADFDAAINEQLQRDYFQLIQDMREAKKPDLARELLVEALGDFPDNQPLQSLQQPAD